MYSLFLHEFGHWLGFQHSDMADGPGNYCNHSGSIMENGYVGDWDKTNRDLTEADVCLFKKLYCCDNTKDISDVEAIATAADRGFEVLPNPTRSGMLDLRFTNRVTAKATLRFVNVAGETVLEKPVSHETREVILDVHQLPSGWYMIEVVSRNVVFAKKVLIEN